MNVKTFETRSGQKPIDHFIKEQDIQTRKKIAFLINLLEHFGVQLGMPYSKKITDRFYELRVRGKVEIRVICAFKGNDAILLNIFKKKQSKIPRREIEIAKARMIVLD